MRRRPSRTSPPYEIYRRELVKLGHGYPLWHADPYDQEAVELGDVGYVKFGKFLWLDHVNLKVVVPHHSVYQRRIELRDVLASESVKSVQTDVNGRAKYIAQLGTNVDVAYVCESSQGAILNVAQPSAIARDLDDNSIHTLRHYMADNYKIWHAQNPGVPKGEILLVTGTLMSYDWEAAVWSPLSNSYTSQTVTDVNDVAEADKQHRVDYSSGHKHPPDTNVTCKFGSGFCDVRKDVAPMNQCLFLRGMRVRPRRAAQKLIKESSVRDQTETVLEEDEVAPQHAKDDTSQLSDRQPEHLPLAHVSNIKLTRPTLKRSSISDERRTSPSVEGSSAPSSPASTNVSLLSTVTMTPGKYRALYNSDTTPQILRNESPALWRIPSSTGTTITTHSNKRSSSLLTKVVSEWLVATEDLQTPQTSFLPPKNTVESPPSGSNLPYPDSPTPIHSTTSSQLLGTTDSIAYTQTENLRAHVIADVLALRGLYQVFVLECKDISLPSHQRMQFITQLDRQQLLELASEIHGELNRIEQYPETIPGQTSQGIMSRHLIRCLTRDLCDELERRFPEFVDKEHNYFILLASFQNFAYNSEREPEPAGRKFEHGADFSTLWNQLSAGRTDLPESPAEGIDALDWTGHIGIDEGEHGFIGGGAFGDVYHGKWNHLLVDLDELPKVALKVMRVVTVNAERAKDRFRQVKREVTVWQQLKHFNIVPFIGVVLSRGKLPSLASLWMDNGSVKQYLLANPKACRLSLALGVLLGLEYLHYHEPEIIHGDLKADNVLVDKDGTPRLIDFGLSRITTDQSLWDTSATTAPGTTRWKSPELMTGDQITVTTQGDIWSYAMTSLEIMTGRVPFHKYHHDVAVVTAIVVKNERPDRPDGIDDRLWSMWEKCWATSPADRPNTRELLLDSVCLHDMNRYRSNDLFFPPQPRSFSL